MILASTSSTRPILYNVSGSIIALGDNDVSDLNSVNLPITVTLRDAAGNHGPTITNIPAANAPGIDANPPILTVFSIGDSHGNRDTVIVGRGTSPLLIVVQASLPTDRLDVNSTDPIVINGFSGNRGDFIQSARTGTKYSFTINPIPEGFMDRSAGDTIPVHIVLYDKAGNPSNTISEIRNDPNNARIRTPAIDGNSPQFSSARVIDTTST